MVSPFDVGMDPNRAAAVGRNQNSGVDPMTSGPDGQRLADAASYTGIQSEYGYNAPSGSEGLYNSTTGQIGTSNFDMMQGLAPGAQFLDPRIMQMLYGAAQGKVPSAAEMQQKQGLDAILRSQMAARASQRGSGAVGASNRLAGESANQAQLGVAGQTAMLRAQEQEAARAQLLGAGTTNLQSQQLYDQIKMKYLAMGYSMDEADRQAAMQMAIAQAEISSGNAATKTQNEMQVAGALAGAIATTGGAALGAV